MVAHGFDLVFGGGGVGLMGEVAREVSLAGGKVLGIIPSFLRHVEPPLKISSEIVITETMNERKARMFAACDAFAVLPGGIGTLDEFAECLTGAQLRVHAKPIVLVNVKDYFAPLTALLEHFIAHGFMRPEVMRLIHAVPTVEDALVLIETRLAPAQAGAPSR
jgi:uncharacterized protein (TIGR00730 family)